MFLLQLALWCENEECPSYRISFMDQLFVLSTDPFDKGVQFLVIFSLLRLLHDYFASIFLFSFSFGYLITSIFLLRNYRYVWLFEDRNLVKKKVQVILSSMLLYSILHMYLASELRVIFFDAHVSLLTFLLWRYEWEQGRRPVQTRERQRSAQRG